MVGGWTGVPSWNVLTIDGDNRAKMLRLPNYMCQILGRHVKQRPALEKYYSLPDFLLLFLLFPFLRGKSTFPRSLSSLILLYLHIHILFLHNSHHVLSLNAAPNCSGIIFLQGFEYVFINWSVKWTKVIFLRFCTGASITLWVNGELMGAFVYFLSIGEQKQGC